MPTRPHRFDDPAAEASQFMIRLGLAVLAIALPASGLYFRRSVFLLFPMGAGVILLGALLAPRRDALGRLRDVVASPMGLVACVLLAWATASILWTPYRGEAVERLFKVGGTLALAAAAAAVLPDRTRIANLYLIPVGVALASALGAATAVVGVPAGWRFMPDAATLERALVGVSLAMWPALAVLIARGRIGLSVTLPILVAATAFVTGSSVAFFSMAAGGLALAAALGSRQMATRWLGRAFAALVILAPLAPFLAQHLSGAAPGGEWARHLGALDQWRALIDAQPLRLLTGHGLDAAGQGVARGALPATTPRTAIFDVWYELGLVGALATAALLYGAFRVARRAPPEAGPALAGGLTHGLIVGALGGGSAQIAWLTTIATAAVLFTAMANGLYKTSRPAAPAPRSVKAPAAPAPVRPAS